MLLLACALAVISSSSVETGASGPPFAPEELAFDVRIDAPVTAGLVAAWVLSETALKSSLAPGACRWCATNSFDLGVRGLFNGQMQPSTAGFKGADVASTIVGLIGLPVAMAGLDALLAFRGRHIRQTFLVDVLLIAEATAVAMVLTQITKFSVGRARPYTVGSANPLPGATDDFVSFFSGHSSFAFAVVSSAATVMQLRNMPHAWLAWAVGLPLATATAVLRLSADKHWASDVLVGTAIGLSCGVLIPRIFHPRKSREGVSVSVAPSGSGAVVFGTF
jgi:membrane-associated phospholipid phosphatase